jgi:DNA-binding HxlR family transcriptional regulator
VLWALRDGHRQTFRLLQDSVGGITPNTLNTRLKELRQAGLVDHAGEGYGATDAGRDLLKRLNDLHAFAGRWVATLPKKVEQQPPAASATGPVIPAVPPAAIGA